MDNIEKWADAIVCSINKVADPESVELDGSNAFCPVAIAIVEPVINDAVASEEYANFMEEDRDNWAQWIQSSFGPGWGAVARYVAENGY